MYHARRKRRKYRFARSGSAVAGHHYAWESRRAEEAAGHRICSATLAAASRSIALGLRLRSPRSPLRPPPARQHWPGCVGTLPGEHLLGKSCPKGCRTDSSVRTWLSPVVNSAASQPNYAKLLAHANLRGCRRFIHRSHVRAPSLHRHSPASAVVRAHPPSARADSVPRGRVVAAGIPTRSAPRQTSLVAHKSSRARVVTTTPAERSGAYLARLPDHGGLPRHYGGSASAGIFSGPARCSLSLRPAHCASFLTEGFS